ncbi:branched-chain alpha-keto acid dehydrogenase subunit E2 [Haladaptatus paucihalophilus DX253]|uniref:Branched-chain alpha-keto acid dehydrogenase subunit E2 n=1 Tax=Haladaptatus paucihalophilus DX253 TaxID=797209 RepID=E7QXQ8_HALPU|nr:2-oxo acid dehydrogenase subunit E2 [Haladaptatus paucihalophilus]EFW90609.1 branched-chain alpha-keto acid dehydrogenase subunit E2 [Haladaptatus paucihalophilus DX253]SHL57342.1 pyruvate dehydrogenase E2 component (dihydrolipoamide acetyltransferase) [Haladaptatus paucihalophilus DX253]
MVREFKLPDVGEGVAEGELVSWQVEEGDTVTEDQAVAEVETDKAIVEIPSPVNGTVRELLAEEGEVVPVGNVLLTFNVEGEEAEPEEEATESAEASTDSQEAAAEESSTSADAEETETPEGRVFAAPSARRLARELGVDIASVEGTGPSGRVSEHDVRAAAESATESEAEEESEAVESEPADSGPATETGTAGGTGATTAAAPAQVESADRERTLAAPATRRLADEQGIDINAVPSTEERDGQAFVTPEAVREYAEAQQQAQAADAAAVATGETGPREERIPYRGIRRTIGKQMQKSKFTAPHVTHHDSIDVTELVETRAELKEIAEERGIKLTYMPFVLKAIVAALKDYPYLNSALDEENDEIVVKNYYNIGIAVATDDGLMVPVLKDVDKKDMLQISSEMNELVEKARDRTISREEMQGGTFTITNFGAIGGEYATPIINHPEVGILGLGELKKRPVVVDDEVEARYTLPISMSIDHRIIDGAVVASFANQLLEYLHNPRLLLLE